VDFAKSGVAVVIPPRLVASCHLFLG
jgi:hypothetical protein